MTTRLLVLADTHMPRHGRSLPAKLLKEARAADLIVHLGDFTGMSVVEELDALGTLVGVHGNNDSIEVRSRFPARTVIEVDGFQIALLHGHLGGRTAEQAARAVTDADIVLFGHSHMARVIREDGRLLFNPGSSTDRRFAPHRTFGILEVGQEVRPSIIQLD